MVKLTKTRKESLVRKLNAAKPSAGFETDNQDWSAHWDSKLEETENLANIAAKFGIALDALVTKSVTELAREAQRQQNAARELDLKAKESEFFARLESKGVVSQNSKIIGGFMDALLASDVHLLFISGRAGTSKSYSVFSSLKAKNLEQGKDFIVVSGHITNLKFFELMQRNPSALIVLDDISQRNLKDDTFLALMKAATWSVSGLRVVTWNSSSKTFLDEGLAPSFEFNGKLVVLSNVLPQKDDFKAVLSRGFVRDVALSYEEVKNLAFRIVQEPYKDLTLERTQEAFRALEAHASVFCESFNLRSLILTLEIFRAVNDSAKRMELIRALVELPPELEALKDAYDKYQDTADRQNYWCNLTGRSRASYFRMTRAMRLNGFSVSKSQEKIMGGSK